MLDQFTARLLAVTPKPVLAYSGAVRTRWIIVIVAIVAAAIIGITSTILITLPQLLSAIDEGQSDSPARESDDDFGTVTVYSVQDNGTLDPAASGLTGEVWQTFVRVTTIEFASAVMIQYRVGDAPNSDTLAYVYQDQDPQYWILATNLATSDDPQQLIATLIHEYAHILTLGVKQVDPSRASCDTISLDEGCAGEDSVLHAFSQEFWAGYGDAAPDAANTDADVAYDFYLEHEEDFVSDYAATNVVEDIAESFMTFVLEDEPTGESVAARKLAFFWNYPEMVDIRERIRTEFAEDLGLTQ